MEYIQQRKEALSDSKKLLLEKLLLAEKESKMKDKLTQLKLGRIKKRDLTIQNIPCTHMQKSFWYTNNLSPETPVDNTAGYVRFHGELNTEYLTKSFYDVINRHEILRSRFISGNGKVSVIIDDEIICDPKIIDLTKNECADNLSYVEDIMYKEARRQFDLEKGPLIRFTYIKISNTEWIGLIAWHHIISDGASTNIFTRELFQYYEYYVHNTKLQLPEINVQFYDYAVYLDEKIKRADFKSQLDYWKKNLQSSSLKLELPVDFDQQTNISYNGGRVNFTVPSELEKDIIEVSKKYGVTMFTLLMVALKILLFKYTKQSDLIVGIPVNGRNEVEVESLVGCFLNMIPIRSNLTGKYTLSNCINLENRSIIEALDNQDIPFSYIIEELHVERDIQSTPVYQVAFSYEDDAMKGVKLSDISIEFDELDLKTAKVDLALEINKVENGLKGWFEYKSDKFSENRIERLKDYYMEILRVIATNENLTLDEVDIIPFYEKDIILNQFNKPIQEYPKVKTIKNLFEEILDKAPERIAIVSEDMSMTYNELNRRSNQIANFCRKKGVESKNIVALAMKKSAGAIAAILGIIKAGAAYLPIDPSYPEERIRYMLKDSNAQYVITDDISLMKVYRDITIIDPNDKEILDESTQNLPDYSSADDLAYVIYTSGTTGEPKGVMLAHKGISNLRDYYRKEYQITEKDGVLQFANLVFDASVWEITMGVLSGAKLCIVSKSTILDPGKFRKVIEDMDVTIALLPPQYWELISDEGLSLRLLITGGSASNCKVVSCARNIEIYDNAYGPTEITVCATHWKYDKNQPIPSRIPIGKPIEFMQVYVMDGNQLSGIGNYGELYIGGIGVAKGYLNNKELTAEKFIDNPFGPGKLYRTGDYGRWLEDGNIEFIGRVDNQVKIRGYRIELGEIESQLSMNDCIKTSIVTTDKDGKGEDVLVAYIVAERQFTVKELNEFLSNKLASYMIPNIFRELDHVPLTVNGKTDYKKLKPLSRSIKSGYEYVQSTNEIEEKLLNIWSELLQVDNIGVYDNFFDLGGDSIISMQIIARAAEQGIHIDLKSFYKDATIQAIAINAKTDSAVICSQEEIIGEADLTLIQKWFAEMNFEEYNYWNQSVIFKLNKNIDIEAFDKTLNLLLRHHDELRAKWIKKEDHYEMYIPAYEQKKCLQLAVISEGDNYQEMLKKIILDVQKSISVESGDVFKAVLIKAPTLEESRLLLTAHHLVCDGVSYRIIVEYIYKAYESLLRNEEVYFQNKTTSYLEWTKQLKEYIESEESIKKQEAWINDNYNNIKSIPKDMYSSDNLEKDIENVVIQFSEDETADLLNQLPEKYSMKPQEIMIAALIKMLYKWNPGNPVIYLESHGRDILADKVDLSRTVGWFTNLYPLYFEYDVNDNISKFLKKVKNRIREVEERKVEFLACRKKESMPAQLLNCEVSFNYLGHLDNVKMDTGILEMENETSLYTRGDMNRRVGLIEINSYVMGGHLYFDWIYNQNIHRKDTVVRNIESFKSELVDIINYCFNSDEVTLTVSDYENADIDSEDLEFILAKFN